MVGKKTWKHAEFIISEDQDCIEVGAHKPPAEFLKERVWQFASPEVRSTVIPDQPQEPSSARHAPRYVANTTRKIIPRSSATAVVKPSSTNLAYASKDVIVDRIVDGCVEGGKSHKETHEKKAVRQSKEKMRSVLEISGSTSHQACHDQTVWTTSRIVPAIASRRRVLGEVARQGQTITVDHFGSGSGKENVPPEHAIDPEQLHACAKEDCAATCNADQPLLTLPTIANTQKKRVKPFTLMQSASLQHSVRGDQVLSSTITATVHHGGNPAMPHFGSITSQSLNTGTKRKSDSVKENAIQNTGTSASSRHEQSLSFEHEDELLLLWFQSLVLSL